MGQTQGGWGTRSMRGTWPISISATLVCGHTRTAEGLERGPRSGLQGSRKERMRN